MALRVLSYNILHGGQDRLTQLVSVIRQQKPDVVAILEATSRTHAETLARELQMHLAFGEAKSGLHVAWLSRPPVVQAKNHWVAVFTRTLLEIEINWEGVPLHLFATHLQSGRDMERERQRIAEMRTILDILQPMADQPHMLVGDLNALHPTDHIGSPRSLADSAGKPGTTEYSFPRDVIPLILATGYVDCYRTLHPTAPGYTYKLPSPWLRLDYIFASPLMALRLHSCEVVTGEEAVTASDHFPVWAEFR